MVMSILMEEESEDLVPLREYLVEVFTIGELSGSERAELKQLGRSELASRAVRCMEILEENWREVETAADLCLDYANADRKGHRATNEKAQGLD